MTWVVHDEEKSWRREFMTWKVHGMGSLWGRNFSTYEVHEAGNTTGGKFIAKAITGMEILRRLYAIKQTR